MELPHLCRICNMHSQLALKVYSGDKCCVTSRWFLLIGEKNSMSLMLLIVFHQVILDLKGSDYSWSYQTPPSSPSTTMSRKSSVCR